MNYTLSKGEKQCTSNTHYKGNASGRGEGGAQEPSVAEFSLPRMSAFAFKRGVCVLGHFLCSVRWHFLLLSPPALSLERGVSESSLPSPLGGAVLTGEGSWGRVHLSPKPPPPTSHLLGKEPWRHWAEGVQGPQSCRNVVL